VIVMGFTPTRRVKAPRRRSRSPTAFTWYGTCGLPFERQLSGLERPIRGYRANSVRRFGTDAMRPDGEVDKSEPRVSGRPFLLAVFAKIKPRGMLTPRQAEKVDVRGVPLCPDAAASRT